MTTNFQDRIAELEQTLAELKQQQCNATQLPKMIPIPDRHYSVATTPTTVAQYKFFCNKTDHFYPDQPEFHSSNNPIVLITWQDAREYCNWLSQYTGQNYRLPTEDEFEHFCGDHKEATEAIAGYDTDNTDNTGPIGTKKPNMYGLYDVLGLVWEWQENLYKSDNIYRVVRGGSWINNRDNARAAGRDYYHPDSRYFNIGFRVLCAAPEQQ